MAIQQGLLASRLSCSCECFPIADGGNGTRALLVERLHGERVEVLANDPLGRPLRTSFGWIEEGHTAIIEMADASGLHLLSPDELNPLHTNSYGTGQLIKAALDHHAQRIVVGMGGSATVDGGAGILAALGVRFVDEQGLEITDLPTGLQRLHAIDRSAMDGRLHHCQLIVLCDVTNPLLGPAGAARVFGPQKGATPEMVEQLETILQRFAAVVQAETGEVLADMMSGGVAGGASAGLKGVLGAELVNGIDYFLQLTQFERSLKKSDLVITGEGSIDSQTLQGKAPFGVAKTAKQLNLPVIGLAGRVPAEIEPRLNAFFDMLLPIGNAPMTLDEAIASTATNLTRTAKQVGNLLHALLS